MGLRKIRDLENAHAFLADARNAGVAWQTWAKATGVDGRSVWRWIERLGSETELTRQGDISPSHERPHMVELISNPTLSSSSQTIRICRRDFVVEVDKDFDEQAFVGIEPVDMRGSFRALAGAARRLGLEPLERHYYLFFNRRCRQCFDML